MKGLDVVDRTAPPRDLEPLVEALAGRLACVGRAKFPVFPTARAELIFHFGDPFLVADTPVGAMRPLPRAVLLGPRRQNHWQSAGPQIDWFLIQLTPLGCRQLLGLSFAEVWNREIDLADLPGLGMTELHERLRGLTTFRARVALAVATLRAAPLNVQLDPISRAGRLAREGRIRSLAQLGARLDVGPRRLHQSFVANYGIGPKYFLSLMRFGRQLTARHPSFNVHSLQEEPEYADDSHAIREFRRFANLTPAAYARQKSGGDRLVFTGAPIFLDAPKE